MSMNILQNIFLLKPLIIVSLMFSVFISMISAMISIKKFEFFNSTFVTRIINIKVIYNFSIFCLIFSRFFLNQNKKAFKIYLICDFFILASFFIIRVAPIFYPEFFDLCAIQYIFFLSFCATMDLMLRGIVKFGFLVDNTKPFGIIDFFDWQTLVGQVGRAFRHTVSQSVPKTPLSGGLPQAGKDSANHVNDLNKVQIALGVASFAMTTVGVCAGIIFGFKSMAAAEVEKTKSEAKIVLYQSEIEESKTRTAKLQSEIEESKSKIAKNNAKTEFYNHLMESTNLSESDIKKKWEERKSLKKND